MIHLALGREVIVQVASQCCVHYGLLRDHAPRRLCLLPRNALIHKKLRRFWFLARLLILLICPNRCQAIENGPMNRD